MSDNQQEKLRTIEEIDQYFTNKLNPDFTYMLTIYKRGEPEQMIFITGDENLDDVMKCASKVIDNIRDGLPIKMD